MDIKRLKRQLSLLAFDDLEKAGILHPEEADGISFYTSKDEYDAEVGETMIIASANVDDFKRVIIINGMLYNEEQQKETGKEAEVARIFVDADKAEMIIDAMNNAFPEIINDYAEINAEIEEEDGFCECDTRVPEIDDYDLVEVKGIDGAQTIDEAIGNLKKSIYKLEKLKKQGNELVLNAASHCIAVSKKAKSKDTFTSDDLIDAHIRIRDFFIKNGYVDIKTEKKGKNTIYIAKSDKKQIIGIANIKLIARQKLAKYAHKEMDIVK